MDRMIIEIKGRLPSLNEFIGKNRHNKYAGNKFKQDIEQHIISQITDTTQFSNPVEIHFYWIEENKRRDLDNIYSAKKYILDALQKVGILKNDSQKYVVDLFDHHPTFEKEGGVVVEIIERG